MFANTGGHDRKIEISTINKISFSSGSGEFVGWLEGRAIIFFYVKLQATIGG